MQLAIESLESISLKIKNTRKVLGLSQRKLAMLSGVSQSTIAKLESNIRALNPSYSVINNIIDALNEFNTSSEATDILNNVSNDIMHKNIIFVNPNDTIEKAIKIIKNYDFAQIPVLDSKRRAVGTVNQKKLLAIATQNPESISKTRIKDVLNTSLPQVDKNTPVSKLKPILENFEAVLVVDNGKALGIITIYDILKLL